MEDLDTRYARAADGTHIAYQVGGTGPDAVWIPNWFSDLEIEREPGHPFRAVTDRIRGFARLVTYDQRGSGVSDPIAGGATPTLEHGVDDLKLVLDVAESLQATLIAVDSAGPIAMLFAASRPERVSGLVLINSFARARHAPDYPAGVTDAAVERTLTRIESQWGTGAFSERVAPSAAAVPGALRGTARGERQIASPGAAVQRMRVAFDTDVRHVLATIQAPTLVVHRRDNQWIKVEHGRYLAEHIGGARLVELDGKDHYLIDADRDPAIDEIEEFITGHRQSVNAKRILATVLFSDIVNSTEQAAGMGDAAWHRLLDRHDGATARQIERFQGRPIKTLGDGVLATFDGPARAVHCGAAIRDAARQLGLEVRVGLHTGEVELRDDNDITGVAVTIARRIADKAASGDVVVSRTVVDLVAGSGLDFDPAGEHHLKGVALPWHLFHLRQ